MTWDNKLSVKRINHPGVYGLWRRGVCIYIGQSNNMLARVGVHTRDKTFDLITFEPLISEFRYELEKELISYYKPQYNIRGK